MSGYSDANSPSSRRRFGSESRDYEDYPNIETPTGHNPRPGLGIVKAASGRISSIGRSADSTPAVNLPKIGGISGARLSSGVAVTPPNEKTRSKLAQIHDRIMGFERQMESETRNRKITEEERLSAVWEAITKLEKALNGEIKHRVDASKTLQSMFETQITNVQEQFEGIFGERMDQLVAAVEDLTERVTLAERAVVGFNPKADIEEKYQSVAVEIASLQSAIETEKLTRQERDANVTKRLGLLEHNLDNKLEVERAARNEKYVLLKEEVETLKTSKEERDEKFQTYILEEIANTKNAILVESQTRELADDDIVQALNHYTKALQDALRIVNTT